MILVVGATGTLGGEICRLLRVRGMDVRALVRETSSPERVAALKDLGAELTTGDLRSRPSLEAACRGVAAVVSTATAIHSAGRDGNSLETVDAQGQLDLIESAERAGVKRFVLISFPPVDADFPLQTAKRAVEHRLRHGTMAYTILQPTFFMEVWLSPALGFDPAASRARLYGNGRNPISWISFKDVARFAVAALDAPSAKNLTVRLGGPEALSPLAVVHLAEQATGRSLSVDHVAEDALRAQLKAATDSMQQTFAGLMLYYAHGEAIDMATPLQTFPIGRLTSVSEYFARLQE